MQVLNRGTDDEQIVITGRYSFTGTDGNLYEVSYTADKDGYRVDPPGPEFVSFGFSPADPQGIDPNLVKSLFG